MLFLGTSFASLHNASKEVNKPTDIQSSITYKAKGGRSTYDTVGYEMIEIAWEQ